MQRFRPYKKSYSEDLLIFATLAACAIYWQKDKIVQSISGDRISDLIDLGVGGTATAILWTLFRLRLNNQAYKSLMRKAQNTVNQHAVSLARRKIQLIQPDAYGKHKVDKWEKEIEAFVIEHVISTFTPREFTFFKKKHMSIIALLKKMIEQATLRQKPYQDLFEGMNPSQFETFCAEQLRQCGWSPRVTSLSHDQGIDVVAEKDGKRLVLQCKFYSKPVGNKAVQEIVAGKAFEQADYAIVVTNNSFTPAAEQLAATNNVYLLHYLDLKRLNSLLSSGDHLTFPSINPKTEQD